MDLQSIGIYSESDIQYHIRTQKELISKMDKKQRQSFDQNLQDYSGYLKTIVDTSKILKTGSITQWRKYRPQDISLVIFFQFHRHQKRILGVSRMTLLYIRKVDYIISNVQFYWIFLFILKRNL